MYRLRNIAMRDYQESVLTGQTDRRTDGQTDAGLSDPCVPLCFAGDTKMKSRRSTNSLSSVKSKDAMQREKGDLTQSYEKTPIPTENSKTKGQHTNAIKNFDYTTIADRLRTVSWSNNSHPIGVVNNKVMGISTRTVSNSGIHIFRSDSWIKLDKA